MKDIPLCVNSKRYDESRTLVLSDTPVLACALVYFS